MTLAIDYLSGHASSEDGIVDNRSSFRGYSGAALRPLETPHPADVVAAPHITLVDLGAVDHWRVIFELDPLQHLAGIGVEPEERIKIGIRIPQCLTVAVPYHVMRTISGHWPGVLDFPGFLVDYKHGSRRWIRIIQEAISVNDSVRSRSSG